MVKDRPASPVDSATLSRHAAWWERRESLWATVDHRPLGDLWLPLADGSVALDDVDVTPDLLDLDRLAGPPLGQGPLARAGDLFRIVRPFVRVPWVEAILGCPIRATIAGGSMRTSSFVSSWDDWAGRPKHHGAQWLGALLDLTRLLVERAGGKHAVAPTLMRGPCDLAEAVLGPELMCLSMYDHPAELSGFLDEVTVVFIEALVEQLKVIPQVEGGYVNPFGIWAPGTVVRTQCDASAILSPAHYAEWYIERDREICAAFDYSIIHLHSVSLHTVEPLMLGDRPQAIQVTVETTPGSPTIEEMLPVFARILASKCLVVDGQISKADHQLLETELPGGGLCVINRLDAW